MKKETKYSKPQIEVLDLIVEQGFASSKGGLGNEGETGPDLIEDEWEFQ